MALETYRTWARLFELQRYYSWIVDRFRHLSPGRPMAYLGPASTTLSGLKTGRCHWASV